MRDVSLALPPQVHIDAGIGAAAQLLSAGVIDICVIEKQNQLGGVWRENTYPGCACDVPSAFYSYSFAPNAHWKRFYGQQEEIRQYHEDTASASGVLGKIAGAGEWLLQTSMGSFTARFVIFATGPMHVPSFPDLPGALGRAPLCSVG